MAPAVGMLLQVLVDPELKIEDQLRHTSLHWLRNYKYGERISYQPKTVHDNGENTSKHRNKGTSKCPIQMRRSPLKPTFESKPFAKRLWSD